MPISEPLIKQLEEEFLNVINQLLDMIGQEERPSEEEVLGLFNNLDPMDKIAMIGMLRSYSEEEDAS